MVLTRGSKGLSCLPVVPSEYGRFVCVLNGNDLSIVSTQGYQTPIRNIILNEHLASRVRVLRWSKPPGEICMVPDVFTSDSQRLLCANGNHLCVWDVYDETWSANIETPDKAGFAHVDFAANHDEVIAISEFNVQVTIFSLVNGEQRVIKSPKLANANGYAFRPITGHFALLLNVDANDTLALHQPETYEVITTVILPTVDAQGVKWSPNGAWLAVWDSASVGTKVVVYTADGQHYRTYAGEADDPNLGIKTVEWSPDSQILALGKHDATVELLSCNTFTLITTLADPMSFGSIGRQIYAEQSPSSTVVGEYVLAPKSAVFPYTYNNASSTRAVSSISFNPTGTMVAIIDQGLPHIVWLWSRKNDTFQLAGALIQKSAVKQVLWCPKLPELLMTVSDGETPTVHQWICGRVPRIALVPIQGGGGKYAASWIKADGSQSGIIWFGSQIGYMLGYVDGHGAETEFIQISNVEDEYPALSAEEFPAS
ncbi:hypothetical protein AJ80_01790 [Polytolypa hystricis UAMH7299]|uniref:Anaphase-promoting complex subunit 4 WD40 domain-containing protein n=1 Tax=Polytolypa hystricis (strain UAMH7299) TaxID=1447883 RepID=A0A2B7YXT7_POLH7|nr:hypothetical protein AJ80_01790 [Polytolypa hystricis UAMH7299]